MANKKIGCLAGCGVGCLILIVATVVLFGTGAWWFRDTMGELEDAVEIGEALEARHGEPEDFVPAVDGSIAPERMEAFLAVRESTDESRERITAFFDGLPLSEEEAEAIDEQSMFEQLGTALTITTSAIGFGSDVGSFYQERNLALDRHDMGLGEYTYIYVVAYYSWLGYSPDDGPGEDSDMRDDFADRFRRVRRTVLAQLENQHADAGRSAGSGPDPLADEIAALRADRWRVPWQDGLPAAIESSLAPYRDRLEATYDSTTNPFELATTEKGGRFHFEID